MGVPRPVSIPITTDVTAALHIGPTTNRCIRPGPSGPITSCDFVGVNGVRDAAQAPQATASHLLVYDDLGAAFSYAGDINLPANARLSTAPGMARENAEMRCGGQGMVMGENTWVHDLRIAVLGGCNFALRGELASRGHQVENLEVHAVTPRAHGHQRNHRALEFWGRQHHP